MRLDHIEGLLVLEPRRFVDDRGYFCETWNQNTAIGHGLPGTFVQDNESLSTKTGTVRGLHFQIDPHAQGKLVRVGTGAVLDVAVDLRQSSATFGKHMAVELSADNGKQLWIPPGFAHGFCTLRPDTRLMYKVTDFYDGASDRALRFDDPQLGVEWPIELENVQLSEKDRAAPSLSELKGDLFQ